MVSSNITGSSIASLWQSYAGTSAGGGLDATLKSIAGGASTALSTTSTATSGTGGTATGLGIGALGATPSSSALSGSASSVATAFQQMAPQLQGLLLQQQDSTGSTLPATTAAQQNALPVNRAKIEAAADDALQTVAGQYAQSMANVFPLGAGSGTNSGLLSSLVSSNMA